MKRTLLMALLTAALAAGCGGGDGGDSPAPAAPAPGAGNPSGVTPSPGTGNQPGADNQPGAAVQPRFDYAGVWMEHDERCEWSQSAGQYELDVEVITRVSDGVFQRADVDRYFTDAQCSGAPARNVTTSVQYLYVVGQGQLADGTAVDMIQKTAQIGGAVRERCVAFVQDGKLFDECSDAPRPFPTHVERHEWDVRLPS